MQQKSEMLENLLEIEVACNLLKGDADDEQDPLDAHYAKLKTDIKELDKSSQEFETLLQFVKNTHAATHSHYELDVQQVRVRCSALHDFKATCITISPITSLYSTVIRELLYVAVLFVA